MYGPTIFTTKPRVKKGTNIIDTMHSALCELYFVEHPRIPKGKHDPKALAQYVATHSEKGVWVAYPWRDVLMHVPSEKTYQKLRTARNRNLIHPDEQERYRKATVGIAGLSVGSAALATLVATGGPKHLRLADPDIVEITNLNRIRATLLDVGANKTVVAARAAWELDPFLHIAMHEQGLARETLPRFAKGLDVFVDEMDTIEMKFLAREVCRALRIPVVMATDNGDSIILDVERFDREPKHPLFHGRVHISSEEMRTMTRAMFIKLSNEIIDPTVFTMRQQASIMEIGKSLAGVPQLGTAATLAGVAVAYATRRIVAGQDMPSGRYTMGCDLSLIANYHSAIEKKRRAAHTKKFIKSFS